MTQQTKLIITLAAVAAVMSILFLISIGFYHEASQELIRAAQ